MKKKIAVNFVYQASYQLLLVVLPIITIPIVSEALGAEGIGYFNYVNSIVSYFTIIAGLGMSNYGVREISLVRKDKELLSRKFWELQIFNSIFALGTFMIFIVLTLFLDNRIFFMISGVAIFSCLFDITWFFSGMEDFKRITIRNFIVKSISFLLIVLFIKKPEDLKLYFIITSLSIFFSQISIWLSLKRYICWIKVSIKESFCHFKPALEFFIEKVAVTAYQNATKTILGLMTTMTVVGYYSNAFSLIIMSGSIINAMNIVMIPRMSNMFGNNNEEGMIKLLQKTLHLQLYFTIPIMFGVMAVSNQMVDWFFGNDFSRIKDILPWLAPVVVFQSLQQGIASQYLIPKKNMRDYNISVVFGAIVTIFLTTVLVPYLEIYGAVIAINVGYVIISLYRLKVLISDTTFKFEFFKVIKFTVSGLIMYLVITRTTKNLTSNVYTTVLQVGIGILVYYTSTFFLRINMLNDIFKRK